MAKFQGFNDAKGCLTWQDLLGGLLQDQLGPHGIQVTIDGIFRPSTQELTVPHPTDYRPVPIWSRCDANGQPLSLSVARPLEVLFLKRTGSPWRARLADGLDLMPQHGLVLFSRYALDLEDLERLASYIQDMRLVLATEKGASQLTALAVAPRLSEAVVTRGLNPVMTGVYQDPEWEPLHYLNTREVPAIVENAIWKLFSYDPPWVRWALSQLRVNDPSFEEVLTSIRWRLKEEHVC